MQSLIIFLFAITITVAHSQTAAKPSSSASAMMKSSSKSKAKSNMKDTGKSPKSAKTFTNTSKQLEIYDSGVILGPHEKVDDFYKKFEEKQARIQRSKTERRKKQLRKVSSKSRENEYRESNLLEDSLSKDYSNLSTKEMQQEQEQYWNEYKKQIKLRRK